MSCTKIIDNNFSGIFIMMEVGPLFKDCACLLVLDITQDNTPVGFRWSDVAFGCAHSEAMDVSI